MGQITEGFARRMLVRAAKGEHSPLTVWEERQLALAWLEWQRLQKSHEPHWTDGRGLPVGCHCGAEQGAIAHVDGCSEH